MGARSGRVGWRSHCDPTPADLPRLAMLGVDELVLVGSPPERASQARAWVSELGGTMVGGPRGVCGGEGSGELVGGSGRGGLRLAGHGAGHLVSGGATSSAPRGHHPARPGNRAAGVPRPNACELALAVLIVVALVIGRPNAGVTAATLVAIGALLVQADRRAPA